MTTNVTPAILAQSTTLTNATATYITGAALSETIIKNAVFTNFTGGAVTFTVWHVPNAGTAANANLLIQTRSIAAGGTDLAPELINLVLAAGDTIQALAGANTSINFTASGFVAT